MSAEIKKIDLITAFDRNRGIGVNGQMPWHNPEELKHFRNVTMGCVLIMGSRTADSLIARLKGAKDRVFTPQDQEVLSGRTLIVVSRKEHVRDYVRLGFYVERSLEAAIVKANELADPLLTNVVLAGGGQLYKEALEKDLIDTMVVSTIKGTFECDTFFPEFDLTQWKRICVHDSETFTVELYSKRKDLNEPALYSS